MIPRAPSSPGDLPLVYSCSGCSNIAQLANRVAVALDRDGVAEMSCIAGVGGDVTSLVRTARSGRFIVAIDGCRLQCARQCLARAQVEPGLHVTLTDYGLRKRYGEDASEADFAFVRGEVARQLAGARRP